MHLLQRILIQKQLPLQDILLVTFTNPSQVNKFLNFLLYKNTKLVNGRNTDSGREGEVAPHRQQGDIRRNLQHIRRTPRCDTR